MSDCNAADQFTQTNIDNCGVGPLTTQLRSLCEIRTQAPRALLLNYVGVCKSLYMVLPQDWTKDTGGGGESFISLIGLEAYAWCGRINAVLWESFFSPLHHIYYISFLFNFKKSSKEGKNKLNYFQQKRALNPEMY